jgi:Family of unknown function (DUF6390)
MTTSGPQLFARFAYPPNALGYCGPDDARGLLERVAAADAAVGQDGGLRAAARRFEGAWPYLQLIAGANGLHDPLDPRVVEAYWVGNALLDRVDARRLGDSFDERFRRRAGRAWEDLCAAVLAGARPHHNIHVFAVYPWLGLMRSGLVDQPLRVLDRCRVRWGQVQEADGDVVVVRSRHLTWDGSRLGLGAPEVEQALVARDGLSLTSPPSPGSWCALHWDWLCTPLTAWQVQRLRARTVEAIRVVNGLRHSPPAAVLA